MIERRHPSRGSKLSHAIEVQLPAQVGQNVPNSARLSGADAAAFLDMCNHHLTACIDGLCREFEPLALLGELGHLTAYGLPAAEKQDVLGAEPPSERPHRFGLAPASVGMAARIIMERAVLVETLGVRVPTTEDMRDLIFLGLRSLQVDVYQNIASLAGSGGIDMGKVSVQKSGVTLTIHFESRDFDIVAYQEMRAARVQDKDDADLALLQSLNDGTPMELAEISRGMAADLGFDLQDLISVISLGIQLNLGKGYSFLAIPVAPFRNEMISGLSENAVKAFDHLTFSNVHLKLDDLLPSGTRYQPRRIVTHPFIVRDDVLFLFRDIQFEAINRWTRYLFNGDWPTPVNERKRRWPELAAAIERRRNQRGTTAFEPLVERELDDIGLPWGSTSSPNAVIANTRITGEVDAMVVDSRRRTLWVLECKDVTSDQNLRSLRNELQKMVESFVPQVERTVSEVSKDVSGVATFLLRRWSKRRKLNRNDLNILIEETSASSEWNVESVIVVRDRSAAESLIGRKWRITPVSGLRTLLLG